MPLLKLLTAAAAASPHRCILPKLTAAERHLMPKRLDRVGARPKHAYLHARVVAAAARVQRWSSGRLCTVAASIGVPRTAQPNAAATPASSPTRIQNATAMSPAHLPDVRVPAVLVVG